MTFNSWEFAIFFAVVYLVYLLLPRHRWQNRFLLVCGYYFYAAWDWRFLSLLFISTIVDYIAGIQIDKNMGQFKRRLFLVLSVGTQLTILGVFKYFNFFEANLQALLHQIGIPWAGHRLDIVLPVGISFYTFQTMSYTIDIYRRQISPTRNLLDYALYASFFPQLVAGPIERAGSLLPQITSPRKLDSAQFGSGCWLIFWGLYKKVVIADNMAPLVEGVFGNSSTSTFALVYLGALAFAVQIYCDFSGYSDIARGTARLLGFNLMRNFDLPYFASNPREFWRRWHISLSTWLRDYLYISLGGNRKGRFRNHFNLLLTMMLGGLWHGASWNFLWWGIYHGGLLVGHRVVTGGRQADEGRRPSWKRLINILIMFQFTLFGWLLFRSNRKVTDGEWLRDDSLNQIIELVTSLRNGFGFDIASAYLLWSIVFFTAPLLVIQWFQYKTNDHYFMLQWRSIPVKATVFATLVFGMVMWGVQSGSTFIYFQF